MKLLRNHLRKQSGIVALVVALLLPVLIGMLGLVLDLGVAFHYKRIMQTATDAGAFAGAIAIVNEEDSQLNTKVLYDAAKNGFDGSHGETRTINRPPVGGDFAGNSSFVEVIISQQLNTYFMPVLGIYDTTVSTRAVAGVIPSAYCIYVLNGTANKAFETSSTSSLIAPNCGIKIHSCNNEAFSATSGAMVTAKEIDVCGHVNLSGATVTPTPDEHVCDGTPCDRGEDPLAYLPDPIVPDTCDFTEFMTSSLGGVGNRFQINPGTYCGGISIESGSHVNFNPGIYYLKGGTVAGLNIGSNSSATGFGVSFYNTETAGYPYLPIQIQSGSHAEFTAPSGTNTDFDGILFWQDRNISGNYDNKIESDNSSYFEGTLYFPTQHLMFHSNTIGDNAAAWTLLVVDTLEVSSGTAVSVNSNQTGTQPILEPVLVE